MKKILDTNLVLYLPLYEADGSSLISGDAYGHVCAVTGAVWTSRGRSFDKVDNVITIPDDDSLNFGTGDFSLGCWFKRTEALVVSVYNALLAKAVTHLESGPGWNLIPTNSAALVFEMRGANDASLRVCGGVSTVLNTWHHLVIVVSRAGATATVTCYTDRISGTPVVQTVDGSVNNAANFLVYKGYQQLQSEGLVGEVFAYNRALSPQEVQLNYQTTKWRYQ